MFERDWTSMRIASRILIRSSLGGRFLQICVAVLHAGVYSWIGFPGISFLAFRRPKVYPHLLPTEPSEHNVLSQTVPPAPNPPSRAPENPLLRLAEPVFHGERLSGGNIALTLLTNTIVTGAALVALILLFGPLSGAHFNPVVTVMNAVQGSMSWGKRFPTWVLRFWVGSLGQ
jgi:hypothetical protein